MLITHQSSDQKECENLSDIALIQYYYQEWTSYTRGANYVSRLFTYLNRYWVKREKDEGRKGVYPVYIVRQEALPNSTGIDEIVVLLQLALMQWREYMFNQLVLKNNKLVKAVLQQIENHRNGEEVDTTLLKGVIESIGESHSLIIDFNVKRVKCLSP